MLARGGSRVMCPRCLVGGFVSLSALVSFVLGHLPEAFCMGLYNDGWLLSRTLILASTSIELFVS